MSVRTAREIYKSLKTLKLSLFIAVCRYRLCFITRYARLLERMCGKRMILFKVFDFRFVNGKPYDEATFNAGTPVAVITETYRGLCLVPQNLRAKSFC